MRSLPGEAFPTHRTNVGLVDPPVVRADVVGHAVLPFEALLADGALEGLLVRMGQLVAVQVVDVSKGLAAHLAPVVFLDGLGGFLRCVLLLHVAHGGRRHDARARGDGGGRRGEDARHRGDVGRVAVVLPRHGRYHGHHGRGRLGRRLLRPRHHFDAGVAGLVAPQVVAVAEGLVAVAADKRRFALVLLLDHRHRRAPASPAGHIVFEEIRGAGGGLVVYVDGQDGLLVDLFGSRVKQWQQVVLGHMVLVVEGFVGLLMKPTHTRQY